MADSDALESLRMAAVRGSRRSQYRVSVSPAAVLELFRQRDEAIKTLNKVPKHILDHVLDPPRPKPRIDL